LQDLPGGSTGLMTAQYTNLGTVMKPNIVKTDKFDKDLSKELRELAKQVAQDIGDWDTKPVNNVNVEVKFNPITLEGDKEVLDEPKFVQSRPIEEHPRSAVAQIVQETA
jgi:hypothetical protein